MEVKRSVGTRDLGLQLVRWIEKGGEFVSASGGEGFTIMDSNLAVVEGGSAGRWPSVRAKSRVW